MNTPQQAGARIIYRTMPPIYYKGADEDRTTSRIEAHNNWLLSLGVHSQHSRSGPLNLILLTSVEFLELEGAHRVQQQPPVNVSRISGLFDPQEILGKRQPLFSRYPQRLRGARIKVYVQAREVGEGRRRSPSTATVGLAVGERLTSFQERERLDGVEDVDQVVAAVLSYRAV